MLILKRTHDREIALLRAQLSDRQRDVERLQSALEAAHARQVELLDRVLAAVQPASAAVLHPRPIAPPAPPASAADVDLDLPAPPDDIERWLHDQDAAQGEGEPS